MVQCGVVLSFHILLTGNSHISCTQSLPVEAFKTTELIFLPNVLRIKHRTATHCHVYSLSSARGRQVLNITHTCHHRYVHDGLVRLTRTPSPACLPSLYMSLPLVLSPGVIVSVPVLMSVRSPCFLFCSMFVYLLNTLPVLGSQRTRYRHP